MCRVGMSIGPLLGVLCVMLLASSPAAAAAAAASPDDRYITTTVRGALSDPATGKPMEGATVRFVSQAPEGGAFQARTGPDGKFTIEGMPFGDYAVEIETAAGERIYGVNVLPLYKGRPVQIIMKISDRIRTSTVVESRPTRFVAGVTEQQKDWKKFWRELAIFLGISTGVGVAAL